MHFMPLSRERMGNSCGQNSTLISQGSERIGGKRRGEVPRVVARERDVLPAERRDVADQFGRNVMAAPCEFGERRSQIPGVPEMIAATMRLRPEAR